MMSRKNPPKDKEILDNFMNDEKIKKSSKNMAVVFALLFFIAALIPGYFGYREVNGLFRTSISSDWEEVQGFVRNAELRIGKEIDNFHGSSGAGRSYNTWTPIIEYEYDYEGKHYEGKSNFQSTSSSSEANSVIRPTWSSNTTIIFVNPDNPKESICKIERDYINKGKTGSWIIIIGCIIPMLLFLYIASLFYKMRK